jgi:hypothetical protein
MEIFFTYKLRKYYINRNFTDLSTIYDVHVEKGFAILTGDPWHSIIFHSVYTDHIAKEYRHTTNFF